MSYDPVAVERILSQMRQEFMEATSERLTTVDDLITAMMGGAPTEDNMLEIQRHIHSINGQGTTFDFPTVSTVAHRLEDYVETASSLDIPEFQDIQVFVDVIREIIESGIDPDSDGLDFILDRLPVSAKSFTEQKRARQVSILLVFPKGTQRKIIGREMASCGFRVINADTPVDAIRLAIEHRPDIIVTNRLMEQMTGHELAWALSAIERTRGVNMVIASSDEVEMHADALPPNAVVVHKGSDFSEQLTNYLIEWGFFGSIGKVAN